MKYFYDCEFLEGTQRRGLFGWKQTKPTIDLISIGIVDGAPEPNWMDVDAEVSAGLEYKRPREYYAISKDFNLKEAWNRYDLDHGHGDQRNHPPKRVYWIRENVLKPIHAELAEIEGTGLFHEWYDFFSYKSLKYLISKHGKTNKQIADEIQTFVGHHPGFLVNVPKAGHIGLSAIPMGAPEFYGYYSAYDHVALCWLFGKMMDLPKGFPMYTRDLKQVMDDKQRYRSELLQRTLEYKGDMFDSKAESERYKPEIIKDHPLYPKQTNEHNALADAKWNKELYEFLKTV